MPCLTRATFVAGTALVAALLSACAAPGQIAQAPVASSAAAPLMSSEAPTPSATPSITAVDQTDAAPWVDRPGTIFVGSALPVAPLPTDGPPCQASDLKVSFAGSSGAGGELFYWYYFENVSRSSCIVRGAPKVVATEPGWPTMAATGRETVDEFRLRPATIAPGARTQLVLETDLGCASADAVAATQSPAPPTYPVVTVSIPGGGTIVLPGDFGVVCGFYASAFGVQPVDPGYTKSPIDGATAMLELPSVVTAGSVLKYVVDLTNPTSSDMVLDPCPTYWQWIGVASKIPVELNCDAVPVLAAHTMRRFAMELAVPTDVPTGPATAYWNAAAVAVNISARGSLRVVAP
jgi:hypothetical protein